MSTRHIPSRFGASGFAAPGAPLRILEVSGNGTIGTDHAGPASTVITHLANGLVELGHQVTVVDAANSWPRCKINPRVVVEEVSPGLARIKQLAGDHASLNLTMSLAWAWGLAGVVRKMTRTDAFDVIHVHELADALAIGMRCSIPVLLTAHNLNSTMERELGPGPRARFNRWLERAACSAVSHVVVLNRQTQHSLPNANVSVIPNGIDLGAWPLVDRSTARLRLGIPAEEYRVTYLGRIAPEKGAHVFAGAINLASKEIPLVADAIGSLNGKFGASDVVTAYAASVRKLAPTVQFHGFIHHDCPEFRLRVAAADAVIVPSVTEPFGLVVLEALACGAWVIGSDVGGIRDMLSGGVGDLVPPGDPAALADAIVAHSRRGPDGTRATKARERASQFQWHDIVDRYAELILRSALLKSDG